MKKGGGGGLVRRNTREYVVGMDGRWEIDLDVESNLTKNWEKIMCWKYSSLGISAQI